MRRLRRISAVAGTAACVAYLGAAGAIYAQQRTLLFRPDPVRTAPASAGLPQAEEIAFSAPGGPRVLAWSMPPQDAGKPVILYLHGNARSLARRAGRLRELTGEGAGLLALSWRGYGGSEGEPSEAGFRADAEAAVALLASQGVAADRIIVYGESLGSGVAVMVAAKHPVRALVLDSPYESIAAIAAERYWWLPVHLLMKDPFRALDAAPMVRAPVLALACTDDWLTPYDGAQRLMRAFPGPKRLITFDRRCHVPGLAGASGAIMAFVRDPSRL